MRWAVVLLSIGGLLAGCGSSSSTTTIKTPASTPAVTTATVPQAANGLHGNVAIVAGTPITIPTFNHWIVIAAKSQAAQNKGSPAIAPTDPPAFTRCVAQARKQVPALAHAGVAQLTADCRQLFQSLGKSTLDFLITGQWYLAEAERRHITVTDAQVQRAFAQGKASQFRTQQQFTNFLQTTGQTTADVLYRFKINLAYKALLKAEGNAKALNSLVRAAFRPLTRCAPPYRLTPDCS